MDNKEGFIDNCKILISGLQELQIPGIVTQQYTKGLGATLPELSALIPDFTYIEKKDFSCCDEQAVMDQLREKSAKNVILLGIEAHVCVMQTAVDLKTAGFNPVVIMDCVTSRDSKNVEWVKERFRYENIMMTTYESMLFELTRSAGAPEFKIISKLVK